MQEIGWYGRLACGTVGPSSARIGVNIDQNLHASKVAL